jgi:2-desacetyl-2-hydroxyethyl bacteriochlorophyllide A dehydrogenase
MKYIRLEQPGRLSLEEKESPVRSFGNVLLKVKAVGICGTDLHAYQGTQPFFDYPRVLGHELATEIVETSESTARLSVGDRVVIMPYVSCLQCQACAAGQKNCCERLKVLGVHTDGGMQELISVPERLLIPANDLSVEEISIVEPLSIGAHALRRSRVTKDQSIVVIGCGPIGIGIIQLAKYIGAHVIAIDTNEHRLTLAKEKFGADDVINGEQSPFDKLKELKGGNLSDIVFDATGRKTVIESTVDYMRHGGTIVLVGLTNGPLTFHNPTIHRKEASLLCSRNATMEDFEFVMNVLRQKKFNVSSYITRQEDYQSIVSDFDAWAAPDSKDIKILTTWN